MKLHAITLIAALAAGCGLAATESAAAPKEIPWKEVLIVSHKKDYPEQGRVRAFVTDSPDYLAYSVNLGGEVNRRAKEDPDFARMGWHERWAEAFAEGFWGFKRVEDAQRPYRAERVKAPQFLIDAVAQRVVEKPGPFERIFDDDYDWRNLTEWLGMQHHAGQVYFFPQGAEEAAEPEALEEVRPHEHPVDYFSGRFCNAVTLTDAEGREHGITFAGLENFVEDDGSIWAVDVESDGACQQLYPTPGQDASLPLLLDIVQVSPEAAKEFHAPQYKVCLNLHNAGSEPIALPAGPWYVTFYFEQDWEHEGKLHRTTHLDTCALRHNAPACTLQPGESLPLDFTYEENDCRVFSFKAGEHYRIRAVLLPAVEPGSPAYLRLVTKPYAFTPAQGQEP